MDTKIVEHGIRVLFTADLNGPTLRGPSVSDLRLRAEASARTVDFNLAVD